MRATHKGGKNLLHPAIIRVAAHPAVFADELLALLRQETTDDTSYIYVEGRVGDIVDLVTRTCEGHATGQAISYSRVTSGLTSLTG